MLGNNGDKMKYYVVADVHGFYAALTKALTESGFYTDTSPHKLIVCGDLFDRGKEAVQLQDFILDLMAKDEVILIRGNHEDLFVDMLNKDGGIPFDNHLHNGTYDTALQLTGYNKKSAYSERIEFVKKAKYTDYYKKIIPSMVNYFEVGNYIFVHGWIPVFGDDYYNPTPLSYNPNWRTASKEDWDSSRWLNGMDAARTVTENGKTIVCGHWHCSYGHSMYEFKGTEFDKDADFTPYYGKGIIALDACTVHSGFVNCIVLDI